MYLQQHPKTGIQLKVEELIAPGEAIIRSVTDRMPGRLANALFGKLEELKISGFADVARFCL